MNWILDKWLWLLIGLLLLGCVRLMLKLVLNLIEQFSEDREPAKLTDTVRDEVRRLPGKLAKSKGAGTR